MGLFVLYCIGAVTNFLAGLWVVLVGSLLFGWYGFGTVVCMFLVRGCDGWMSRAWRLWWVLFLVGIFVLSWVCKLVILSIYQSGALLHPFSPKKKSWSISDAYAPSWGRVLEYLDIREAVLCTIIFSLLYKYHDSNPIRVLTSYCFLNPNNNNKVSQILCNKHWAVRKSMNKICDKPESWMLKLEKWKQKTSLEVIKSQVKVLLFCLSHDILKCIELKTSLFNLLPDKFERGHATLIWWHL